MLAEMRIRSVQPSKYAREVSCLEATTKVMDFDKCSSVDLFQRPEGQVLVPRWGYRASSIAGWPVGGFRYQECCDAIYFGRSTWRSRCSTWF